MSNKVYTAGITLTILALAGCSPKQQQQAAPPPVSVNVAAVTKGDAVYYEQYPATVTPLNQVDIHPQVSGYITGIFFKDGDRVQKGQKLYTIDQQQYEANYQQAVANLDVQKTNLVKAQKDAERYHFLDKQDAVARQQVDYADAAYDAAKKQVEAAEANVTSVQTSLKYSTIYAPFDGTIGISQVKIGTAVAPGTQVLNSVSQDDPMAVDVEIDQNLIPRFTQLMQKGNAEKDSVFSILLADGTQYPVPGHIYFIDRSVDPTTGTIKARLVFPNPQNLLRAGITTNVKIKNNTVAPVIMIPNKAITEQMGEYVVYVTIPGNKVTQRKITLGPRINDKVVVLNGLEEGEKIVIDGIQKLRDSSLVQIAPPKTQSH
jgi:membrane fusion protein (multidrug efflux system)